MEEPNTDFNQTKASVEKNGEKDPQIFFLKKRSSRSTLSLIFFSSNNTQSQEQHENSSSSSSLVFRRRCTAYPARTFSSLTSLDRTISHSTSKSHIQTLFSSHREGPFNTKYPSPRPRVQIFSHVQWSLR